MSQSSVNNPQPRRHPDDQPTVVDPHLYGREDLAAGSSGDGIGAARGGANHPVPGTIEDQKTVISPVPPAKGAPWSSTPTALELGALLEGKQLGHFSLEEFVGGGGMGAVFRGTDNLLGRTVAIKVLSRDQGSDPETLRRFRNEAQSAARLDHENIARVFFVGEDDGWNFIVFEYIQGTNIRDLVEREGPLPLELAVDFTIQVAEALAHASERDVVHRDIKPSNVLVTADRQVKLVDMGLARLHQMEAGQSDLTASGVTLGTFDYISPEQASDPRRADVRSDLYSLGCTLYFMLTARPPFPQGTVLQKLLAHSGEPPPDPRIDRPELPEELTKILHRLLAKHPDQRYRHPKDLITDLLILRDRLGLRALGAHADWASVDASLSWRDRAIAWGVPVIVLLVAVLGLDLYWSRSSSVADNPPDFRRPAQRAVVSPEPKGDRPTADDAADEDDDANDEAPEDTDGRETLPADPDETASEPTEGGAISAAGPDGAPESGSETDSARPEDDVAAAADDSSGSSADNPADAPPSVAPTENGGGSEAPADDDSALSDSASVVPAPESADASPPGEHVIRRIVVGDAARIGDLGPETRIFASLREALASDDFLRHQPELDVVEIAGGQTIDEQPCRLKLPEGAHLTIRGISAGEPPTLPRLRFAPPTSISGWNGAMLQISGGKLSLDNLQLEMDVPEATMLQDVSLLRVGAGEADQLELDHCVLTVRNPELEQTREAAFIDIVSGSADRDVSIVPVNLQDCILRGRATVVRMRQSVGLDLVWNNGLLITSKRLLLADGSSRPTGDGGDGTIRVRLDNVTADVGAGLCLLRDSVDRPHQPPLELECAFCVIVANGASLIEHEGVGDTRKYRLATMTDRNFYDGIDVFWRVTVDNIEQQSWDWTTWQKNVSKEGMPSFEETIKWSRDRSEVEATPMHLRGTGDYLLDPKIKAAVIKAGSNAEALPPLKRGSEDTEAASASPDTADSL